MTDSKKFARRDFLKSMATVASLGACATAMLSYALAEDLPHLAEVDPTAAALGHKDDATQVDAVKYATQDRADVCELPIFRGLHADTVSGVPTVSW